MYNKNSLITNYYHNSLQKFMKNSNRKFIPEPLEATLETSESYKEHIENIILQEQESKNQSSYKNKNQQYRYNIHESLTKINPNTKEHILKHNVILAVDKLLTGMDEIRVIHACLLGNYQKKEFKEATWYPVNLLSYANKSGITLRIAYTEVKDIVIKFRNTILPIPLGDGSILYTSIVYDYVLDDSLYRVSIQWNKNLIPFLSGDMIPGDFIYVHDKMAGVSSKKRYILYTLLQKQIYKLRKVNSFSLTLKEIREATLTYPSEYTEWKAYNVRVVKPALQDIATKLGVYLTAKHKYGVVTFTLVKAVMDRLL